jgi:hypothetical protein
MGVRDGTVQKVGPQDLGLHGMSPNVERRRLMKALLPLIAAAVALAVPAAAPSPALASSCQRYSATGHEPRPHPQAPTSASRTSRSAARATATSRL